jgi:hypothetical protein
MTRFEHLTEAQMVNKYEFLIRNESMQLRG